MIFERVSQTLTTVRGALAEALAKDKAEEAALREVAAERVKAMEAAAEVKMKALEDRFRAFETRMAAVLAAEWGKGVAAAVKGDDVVSTSF
jgi:hypothetical protein